MIVTFNLDIVAVLFVIQFAILIWVDWLKAAFLTHRFLVKKCTDLNVSVYFDAVLFGQFSAIYYHLLETVLVGIWLPVEVCCFKDSSTVF